MKIKRIKGLNPNPIFNKDDIIILSQEVEQMKLSKNSLIHKYLDNHTNSNSIITDEMMEKLEKKVPQKIDDEINLLDIL